MQAIMHMQNSAHKRAVHLVPMLFFLLLRTKMEKLLYS